MSAETVLAAARGEIGYLEKATNSGLDSKTANAGSANYNKYARDVWPSLQAQPWCDIFVSWCAVQAGESEAVGKFAYVPSHVDFFRRQGRYFGRGQQTPRPGDVIFFRNESHVGLVESVSGGYVTTLEGNTSGGSTLVSNGGGVFRKTYPLASAYIMGYGRPDYAAAPAVPDQWFPAPKTYRNGSTDEICYADTALTVKTGSLNPWEECQCLGVMNGRYLVAYQVDGTDYHKCGWVAYSGGL